MDVVEVKTSEVEVKVMATSATPEEADVVVAEAVDKPLTVVAAADIIDNDPKLTAKQNLDFPPLLILGFSRCPTSVLGLQNIRVSVLLPRLTDLV